ncbi:hypothetical protein V6N13_029930 [Hibiscus sabdariffa]
MSPDSASLVATVSAPGATQSSVAVNNSRPGADPPDLGRHHDPMSLGLASDMGVSSSDVLTPTLVSPIIVLHATLPVSSSPSHLLAPAIVPPSYKDTLMASDSSHQASGNVFTDNEEVALVDSDVTRSMCGKYGHMKDVCPVVTNATGADPATSIPPVAATPSMTDELFGPWMKVERRQRRVIRKDASAKQDDSGFVVAKSRFNPIFEDEATEEPAAHPTLIPGDSHSGPAAPGLSLPTVVDPRSKGKVSVNSNPVKHGSPTYVRKPLVVQQPYATSSSKSGPSPSHRNSSLSNIRFTPFPRPPTWLKKVIIQLLWSLNLRSCYSH